MKLKIFGPFGAGIALVFVMLSIMVIPDNPEIAGLSIVIFGIPAAYLIYSGLTMYENRTNIEIIELATSGFLFTLFVLLGVFSLPDASNLLFAMFVLLIPSMWLFVRGMGRNVLVIGND